MTIERIISGCGATAVNGDIRKEVTLVCNDSRKVVPGSLFVAVKGFATDGHDFISTAVKIPTAQTISARNITNIVRARAAIASISGMDAMNATVEYTLTFHIWMTTTLKKSLKQWSCNLKTSEWTLNMAQ